MTKHATLASITDVLLDDTASSELLREAVASYRDLLLTASGLDLGHEESIDHYDTGSGVAIGATWAALCVDDLIRTKRFICGLNQAVREVAARRPGPVHVLYAGTGPFATLALPLMTRFTPEELQFTCLEITTASFRAVREVFRAFAFGGFVREVIQTDASTYHLDRHLPIDIMLSETMQYCLIDEMQVPISLNLMGQLPVETIMIPEAITLSLCEVADTKRQSVTTDLGLIFRVDRTSLAAYRHQLAQATFPTVRLEIPEKLTPVVQPSSYRQPLSLLAIRTNLRVYGDYGLEDYESGLTIPSIIGHYPTTEDPLAAIEFTYRLHPSPLLWMDFIVPQHTASHFAAPSPV